MEERFSLHMISLYANANCNDLNECFFFPQKVLFTDAYHTFSLSKSFYRSGVSHILFYKNKFNRMRRSYKFRRFRLSIRSFALCVSFCCFIGITLWNFNEENVDTIEEKYIYPPPWFISNWTMNDYFIRKDRLKQLDDRYAQKHQQKVLIESNRKIKPNFTILEYTKVSGGPKFCHQTDELTFGKQCPYKNCR